MKSNNKSLYRRYTGENPQTWMALNDVNILGRCDDGSLLYEYAYAKDGAKRWAKTVNESGDYESLIADVEKVRGEIDEA